MKQANKAIRMKDKEKGDATLHDMGYTDEQIAQLREPDFCGRIGFPDYMLAEQQRQYPKIGRKNQEPAENEVPGNTGERRISFSRSKRMWRL